MLAAQCCVDIPIGARVEDCAQLTAQSSIAVRRLPPEQRHPGFVRATDYAAGAIQVHPKWPTATNLP
jgi:hypothetical protein